MAGAGGTSGRLLMGALHTSHILSPCNHCTIPLWPVGAAPAGRVARPRGYNCIPPMSIRGQMPEVTHLDSGPFLRAAAMPQSKLTTALALQRHCFTALQPSAISHVCTSTSSSLPSEQPLPLRQHSIPGSLSRQTTLWLYTSTFKQVSVAAGSEPLSGRFLQADGAHIVTNHQSHRAASRTGAAHLEVLRGEVLQADEAHGLRAAGTALDGGAV